MFGFGLIRTAAARLAAALTGWAEDLEAARARSRAELLPPEDVPALAGPEEEPANGRRKRVTAS